MNPNSDFQVKRDVLNGSPLLYISYTTHEMCHFILYV